MITIEKNAEDYIATLFSKQDDDNLALKIDITSAGTPMATIAFNFCQPDQLPDSYQKFAYKGFDAYIDKANFDYLKEAKISLKEEGSNQKLTIYAPNAKGEPPAEDAPLNEHIAYTIAAEINPQLASHGGFVELIDITEDLTVIVNFGGGCQGCSSVKMTLQNGIENQLKAKYPQIKGVRDNTDHSNNENAYYR